MAEKKTCIFGETLEGGYPKMLVAVVGEDGYKAYRQSLGDYVCSCLGDMISSEPGTEKVTIEFVTKAMTQEEIAALPDL